MAEHKKRKDMTQKELVRVIKNLVRRNYNMLDCIDTIWPEKYLSREGKNMKKEMIRPTILSTVGMLNHVAEIFTSEEGGKNGSITSKSG